MRKNFCTLIFVLLLFFVCESLFSQPQILPSVEIRSDTKIKAPLIKKPVLFPVEVPTDTIPTQAPKVFSLRHQRPALPTGTIRPLHLDFTTDTSFETKLTASFYPVGQKVPLLKLDAGFWVPATNFSRTALNVSAESDFSSDLRLSHLLSWQQAKAGNFSSGSLSYSVNHLYPYLDANELRFMALRTNISLEGLEQDLAGTESSDFALGIRHSHGFRWDEHRLSNRLVLQDTAFGLSSQYRAPWLAKLIPELDLGLMTDFHHILPAIDFHKRLLLAPGRHLEISNQTELQNLTFQTLKEQYPWSVLPEHERLVMTPLNLSLQAWQAWNNEDALFRLAGLHQSIRFSYNQPELSTRDVSGQTYLRQTDIFSYRLGTDLRLQYWGWKINQDLNLNLEYLQDESWRRRPFSPILSASTKAEHKFGDLDVLASLSQEYWRCDENNLKIPTVFDLSLGIDYPVGPDLRLTATLENIFNTQYHNYGQIPVSGRTFRIAFRYLPLH